MLQHIDYISILTNTIELLSGELYRMKEVVRTSKVSAHDSRFNTKLECMFKSFKNAEKVQTESTDEILNTNAFTRASRVLSKLINQARSKRNSDSKPRCPSVVKEENAKTKSKLFSIGGNKSNITKTAIKKPTQKLTY